MVSYNLLFDKNVFSFMWLRFCYQPCEGQYYFFISFSAAVNAETREEVAIKKVGNAFDNRIDAKRTLREIKLLRHMDHENVISKLLHKFLYFILSLMSLISIVKFFSMLAVKRKLF